MCQEGIISVRQEAGPVEMPVQGCPRSWSEQHFWKSITGWVAVLPLNDQWCFLWCKMSFLCWIFGPFFFFFWQWRWQPRVSTYTTGLIAVSLLISLWCFLVEMILSDWTGKADFVFLFCWGIFTCYIGIFGPFSRENDHLSFLFLFFIFNCGCL